MGDYQFNLIWVVTVIGKSVFGGKTSYKAESGITWARVKA